MFCLALSELRQGRVPTNLYGSIVQSTTHQRRTQAQDLINGEVLELGTPLASNGTVRPSHVCWVRTKDSGIVGCFRRPNGALHELTHQMCHLLWSSIPIRVLQAGNERRLPTGTVVPIVPYKYYTYKLQNTERARVERARPKASPNVEAAASTNAPNLDESCFCLQCLPTTEEREASTIPYPAPDFWTPNSSTDGGGCRAHDLMAAIKEHGIQRITTKSTPTVDAITKHTVPYARELTLRNGDCFCVRSDFALPMRAFDVVAHFVQCTIQRLRFEGSAFDPKVHHADLLFCREVIEMAEGTPRSQ